MRSVFSKSRRGFGVGGLGVLLILSAGCSFKGTVSGKVTVNDLPVRRGTVTFTAASDDKTWASSVPIGEDGSYSIVNAPPGLVKITVASADSNRRLGAKFKDRKGSAAEDANTDDMPPSVRNRFNPGAAGSGSPSVPKRYNDAEKSGLTYEVKPGKQEHDLQLK
jgi:hypothetical protein